MIQLKPQDLRIGNYVNYNQMNLPICGIWSPKPLKDKRFSDKWLIELFDGASTIDCTIDHIHPIPLTEEILLMAGFNKEYKKGYMGIDAGNSDFVLTEPFKIGEWQNDYCFQFNAGNVPKFKRLEFLHELQNIFATFYNEELEINLK